MIRQDINVDDYWRVIVYYNIDYNSFGKIKKEIDYYTSPVKEIEDVFAMLYKGKAKAVTISNIKSKISIVLFNIHASAKDYLNSIIHEAEHIKQAMLKGYNVKDKDEPPAYTIGYVATEMLSVFKRVLIDSGLYNKFYYNLKSFS